MDQLTINIRCQQWLQMIQEQKASGLTIEAWCRENNISKVYENNLPAILHTSMPVKMKIASFLQII